MLTQSFLPLFTGVYYDDNGKFTHDCYYHSWTNTHCQWKIEKGKILLETIHSNEYLESDTEKIYILDVSRIDFKGAIASLEGIIAKHNSLALEKDQEIQEFLIFSESFTKTV